MRNFLAYYKKEFGGYEEVINLPMRVYRTFQYIQYKENLAREEREKKRAEEEARRVDEEKRRQQQNNRPVRQLTVDDMLNKHQQKMVQNLATQDAAQALYEALEDELD